LTWINGGPAPSHETERPLGLNPEAAGTKRAPTAHVKKITQMAAAQSKKNHTIETHKSTSSRSIHPPKLNVIGRMGCFVKSSTTIHFWKI